MSNISFVFLAFNNWPILERTLNSALELKHSFKEPQWVVFDNSTPEFKEEMSVNIKKWLSTCVNSNWIYEQSKHNLGEGGGMNKAFHLATGEYILFFQDDWECCVKYPFIDLAVDVLEKFPHIFMVQMSKREWSRTNKNNMIGRVLLTKDDLTVFEMRPNGFGNNTSQVKLIKKSNWLKVGEYLTTEEINWERSKGHREGSIVEYEYGRRLHNIGFAAAKINDGQFIHTIPENARSEFFITNG